MNENQDYNQEVNKPEETQPINYAVWNPETNSFTFGANPIEAMLQAIKSKEQYAS